METTVTKNTRFEYTRTRSTSPALRSSHVARAQCNNPPGYIPKAHHSNYDNYVPNTQPCNSVPTPYKPYGHYERGQSACTKTREQEHQETVKNMCRPPTDWNPTFKCEEPSPRYTTTRVLQKPSFKEVTTELEPSPGERALAQFRARSRDSSRCRSTSRERSSSRSRCDDKWKNVEAEVENMQNYMETFIKKMDCIWDGEQYRSGATPPRCSSGYIPKAHHSSTSINRLTDDCKVTDEFSATPDPVERVDTDGTKRLVYSLDLDGFCPEDIKVNLNLDDGVLVVEACHEERHCEKYFKRFYNRKFNVPADVRNKIDQAGFRAFLNEQGTLSIEAPLIKESSDGNHANCCPCCTNTRCCCKRAGNTGRSLPGYYSDVRR